MVVALIEHAADNLVGCWGINGSYCAWNFTDFKNAKPLLNSEVKVILERLMETKSEEEMADNAVVQQTLRYVRKFNTYPNREAIGHAQK